MKTWHIDPTHSEVGFKVKHLMVSTVKGQFNSFEGTLAASDDSFTDAKLDFSADVTSVSTRNAQRDAHLQSPDFFDGAAFPKLTFVSKSFAKKDDSHFDVVGDLTLKGITKQATLNATYNGIVADAYGKRVASFDVTGKIHRTDFGINWNAPLSTGGVVVSEDVMLDASIEMKEE